MPADDAKRRAQNAEAARRYRLKLNRGAPQRCALSLEECNTLLYLCEYYADPRRGNWTDPQYYTVLALNDRIIKALARAAKEYHR